MIFYFSGIRDGSVFSMLNGISSDYLVDVFDAPHIPPNEQIGILDSGAFRLFKKDLSIDLSEYLGATLVYANRSKLIAAPDVIGEPEITFHNYQTVKNEPYLKNKILPVWGWGSRREYLDYYLSECKIVGIGNLAGIFHASKTKEERELREQTLSELIELTKKFPGRFHIFGLNYLKAIGQLAPFIYSADSSVWLRGARYAFVIFVHKRSGKLTQAPARAIPQYAALDRRERCILSARNIYDFVGTIESGKSCLQFENKSGGQVSELITKTLE